MADQELSDLTALTGANLASGDLFHVVDVSDTTMSAEGTDKKMTAAEVAAGLSGQSAPRTNSIINGRLDIWQRGTSFTSAAHNTATADRFRWGQSAGTAVVDVTRDTSVPSSDLSYSLKVDVTTANASPSAGHEAHVRYAVEGYDFAELYGKECVLSFWVKSNKTGTHCVAVVKSDDSQTYLATYTVSSADTWEQKTLTIPFDDEVTAGWLLTNGIGCKIRWAVYAGSTFQSTANQWNAGNFVSTAAAVNIADSTSGTLFIADVKMYPGTVAVDIPARPFEVELALCKRYYEKSYNVDVAPGSSTTAGVHLTNVVNVSTNNDQSFPLGQHPRFTVEKRTTPTVVLYTQTGTIATWDFQGITYALAADEIGTNSFRLHNNTGGTVTPTIGRAFGHWTADAEF